VGLQNLYSRVRFSLPPPFSSSLLIIQGFLVEQGSEPITVHLTVTPEPNSMPKIAHAIRLRSGVYKINLKVPKRLREAGAFNGKEKIVESLETREYEEASLSAPIRIGELKAQFAEMLQKLNEGSDTQEIIETPAPSFTRRRRARSKNDSTILETASRGCHFLALKDKAVTYAEALAKEFFLNLLRESESAVEGAYTKMDVETLDAMLSDSRFEIMKYGAGIDDFNQESLVEIANGRKVMESYLRRRGIAYSEAGIMSVEVVHDKFRRAMLENALRTERRLIQVLTALKKECPADVGWNERFDGFFKEVDMHSSFPQLNAGGDGLKPVANNAEAMMQSSGASEGIGMTLKMLCDEFIEYQKDSKVAFKTLRGAETGCAYILAVLPPDSLLMDFKKAEAKKMIKFISRMPKGLKTHVAGQPIYQRVENAWKNPSQRKPISEKTFLNKITQISSVFSYAKNEGYLDRNPFRQQSVTSFINSSIPVGGKGRDKEIYTQEQLNSLFSTPLYTGHQSLKKRGGWKKEGKEIDRKSGRYWAPLLMLFHGCRLNEVAQLMCEDLDIEAEIPYFRISTYQGCSGKTKTPKYIKNKSSERFIPIHGELMKCGFLEFVKNKQKEGGLWLFPEWTHSTIEAWQLGDEIPDKTCKHSDRASDHCLKLRDTVIDTKQKSKPCNHSFRHMFRTALREAGVADKTAEVLQGWSSGKGTMGDKYGEFPLPLLKKALDQARYEGLDLSRLYVK